MYVFFLIHNHNFIIYDTFINFYNNYFINYKKNYG